MLVDDLNSKYAEIAQNYPSNSTRKNYFLAATMVLIQRNSPNIGSSELWAKVAEMDSRSPHGGIIGMGNSKWENRLNKFKIIRFKRLTPIISRRLYTCTILKFHNNFNFELGQNFSSDTH